MKKVLFFSALIFLLIGQYACYPTTSPYSYPEDDYPHRHPNYDNSHRQPGYAPPPGYPSEGRYPKSERHSPHPKAWYGKVIEVPTGDTIVVDFDGDRKIVDLYGIECPERGQHGWTDAWSTTRTMCFWKSVEVEAVQKGGRDRVVGIVWVNGLCINAALLDRGMAWIRPGRCGIAPCREWKELERDAKMNRRGLWGKPGPIPHRRH